MKLTTPTKESKKVAEVLELLIDLKIISINEGIRIKHCYDFKNN